MTHVLRVYHGGRDARHRARERALDALGINVTLVVPRYWPGPGNQAQIGEEPFRVVELPVRRAGDVNRHAYVDRRALLDLIDDTRPDVLDLHEEPFSVAARQWLGAADRVLPVVMYTAQNVDKRLPPPFTAYERDAYRRADAFYPCSRQAASVLRGKGFASTIEVLPLGYDDAVFWSGVQSCDANEIVMMLVGRLVPEKGIYDAVRALAYVHSVRPARLIVSGEGPHQALARRLASSLQVLERVKFVGWQQERDLARDYRAAHVLLVPSHPTVTWVEQFGRVIVEAQASGVIVAGYASGAIPEVAGPAGLIVATGQVGTLAREILRVLSDPREFEERRSLGLRQASTCTWLGVAQQQVDLYRFVGANSRESVLLPASPVKRRGVARAEFGSTAATLAGDRPFALPLLRHPVLGRPLAAIVDRLAELLSRFR